MHLRSSSTLAAAGLALTVLSTGAGADLFTFTAVINGAQEVPPVDTPATGTLSGVYDSNLNTFSFEWDITDNLIGNPASPGAHIHLGGFGVNGPIVFDFAEPDGTWPLSGSAVWEDIEPDLVTALFTEGLYVNFHTDAFPPGEVRGQIVPTPATVGLMGLAGLASARRRRS